MGASWPADNQGVITHLNLLQGIINRLANSSSSCKTWCLALTVGLLSLAGAIRQPQIVASVVVPIVVLGITDAFYLAQERAYRDLFVRMTEKVGEQSYLLSDAFETAAPVSADDIFRALLSWSILPLYGGLLLAYAVAAYVGWVNTIARGAVGVS